MTRLRKLSTILKSIGTYLLELFILGFLVDLFLLREQYDLITFPLLLLWILIIYTYKPGVKYSLYMGIVMLVVTPLFQSLGLIFIAEKSATWAYSMIIVTAAQMFIDFLKS